jgi:hypothetical protein
MLFMGVITLCPEMMMILRSSGGLRVQPGFLFLLIDATGGGKEANAARAVEPLFVVVAAAVGIADIFICICIRIGFDIGIYLCIVTNMNAKIGIVGAAVKFTWMLCVESLAAVFLFPRMQCLGR